MTLLRHDDRLLYFVHIPKTGGSSIEYALRQAGAQRALHHHKRLDGYLKCTPQHMHASLYSVLVPLDFCDGLISVVRHPLDRLLSEYKWRIELGQANRDFDEWVVRHLVLAESKRYILDNHMRPQHEFVLDEVEVFRFEDGLAQPLERASEILRTGPVDVSTRRRAGKKIEVELSTSSFERAVAFYRADFERFGYDPSHIPSSVRLV